MVALEPLQRKTRCRSLPVDAEVCAVVGEVTAVNPVRATSITSPTAMYRFIIAPLIAAHDRSHALMADVRVAVQPPKTTALS
jgi:hypothetical protein